MRARAFLAAAAAIGISALGAGCGQQHAPGSGRTGAPLVELGCVTPRLGGGNSFIITDKDNGKAFCVVAGTSFYVFLHSSQAHLWAPIHPSSPAIVPRPSGVMSLAVGVTGGFFEANRTGTATLTSTRTPCKPTLGPEPNGSVPCTPRTKFKVTLVIRGKM